MKTTKKVLTALMLALVMAVISFAQPVAAMATAEQAQQDFEFIPIRAFFESFEGEVDWNDADRSIHIAVDGGSIVIFVDTSEAYVNGLAVNLPTPIILDQGTAFMYAGDMEILIEIFLMTLLDGSDFLTFYLTEEARDIALYDFDFVVNAILENSAWESVLNRRLGINFQEYTAMLRYQIYNMVPFTLPIPTALLEEMLGGSIYETVFPIRGSDDPRDIAADFLSYFLLVEMGIMFEGIGHLMPRELVMFEMQYSGMRMAYHHGEINRELDPNNTMRHDIFTHPDVVWFYGEIDVDLYADMMDVIPDVPGNIVAEIIVPGEVAYLGIRSFVANWDYDNLITIPFFEEIQDFDHLILDLRGNGGGFSVYFPYNIFNRLISEPTVVNMHEFFSAGDIAVESMNALMQTMQNIMQEDVYAEELFSVEILPARDFISQQGMTAFNQQDLARLEYVMITSELIAPNPDGIIFNGKVWLLVDGGSASASSFATLMLMNTGIATVVGENTSGVMGSHHTYVILPNIGMLFRIDIGYKTDALGNSLEAYGIAPHV